MTTYSTTIKIPLKTVLEIENRIAHHDPYMTAHQETVYQFTGAFSNGNQMDVAIVNDEDIGPWVDYQLYERVVENSGEIGFHFVDAGSYEEPRTKLRDTFELHFKGDTYIGTVEPVEEE